MQPTTAHYLMILFLGAGLVLASYALYRLNRRGMFRAQARRRVGLED